MQETLLNTSCGPIKGLTRNGIRIFRGIDYARCERFSPAVKVSSWDGVYDATDYGTVCPQLSCRLASVIGAEKGSVIDEHRLCLSIYSPEGAKDLPVMVWVHGGAFLTGGSEEKRYSGERLVQAGNVVVVKISYRLGALGYLWMPEKGIGNLGLHDQETALEWIQENISDYGGNPSEVTVFGQSAGAQSLAAIIASSKDRILFRRAILQSPPLAMGSSAKRAERITRKFLRILGKDPFTASIDEILEAQAKTSSGSPVPSFLPIMESVTGIPDATVSGKVEVVCGYTRDDASPFVRKMIGPLFGTRLGDAIVRAATKSVFSKPVDEYVEKLRSKGVKAEKYFITWAPAGNPYGSCHCIEMPFILGFLEDWKDAAMLRGMTCEEFEQMSRTFLKAWTDFANGGKFDLDGSGEPRPDVADWHSNETATEQKKAIRRRMKELRESTSESQATESEATARQIMQLPQWQDSDTVLLYHSIKGEVDTSLLLAQSGKRLVLPVIEGENLVLKEYSEEKLVAGYKGIMEPSSDCPTVDPSDVQLALIPGVAFDAGHHRLGRGKGFYDRLLPSLGCPIIGMGFSWQVIDSVPVESHDITLSGVVTPDGLL